MTLSESAGLTGAFWLLEAGLVPCWLKALYGVRKGSWGHSLPRSSKRTPQTS